MNTTSLYQSDSAAALQLSAQERQAAQELKAIRPECHPGTRAILDRVAAVQWYNKVTDTMRALGIDRDAKTVAAFCDLAGVPD